MTNAVLLNRIIMTALTLVMAWGLKYHYSNANSDDLNWILKPTACLVQAVTNMEFERITGEGYADHENRITIAPACSGVNFMIILFCLTAYTGLRKTMNLRDAIYWIVLGIVLSYSYTLIVNTIRIFVSIHSMKNAMFQSWFSQDTVHLAEGVLIYFLFLIIYYSLLNRIMNPQADERYTTFARQAYTCLLPAVFYFTITLLVPILNHRGIPPGREFLNYALIVLVTCPIVLVLFFISWKCCHCLSVRLKWGQRE